MYPRVLVFVGIAMCIVVTPCLVLPHFLIDFLALLYVDNPALEKAPLPELFAEELYSD